MGDPGVDVANHQMGLDWRVLRNAGYTWGWFKLTEGIGYTDPWSDEHEASARAAGMAHGAYHFARPDTNTPQQDAEWFAHVLRQRGLHTAGHLPPVLDFEDPRPGYVLNNTNCRGASSPGDWARQFLVRATELTGRKDFVTYASTSMIADRMGGDRFMPGEGHRLWVAHYGRNAGQPGWLTNRVIAHQYTSSGRVPGWGGNLDLNVLLVSLDSLLSGAPAPAPTPPQPPGGNNGAPLWPLPPGHYFGPIWGPAESHGGYYPAEKEHVRRIQLALCAKGHARRASGAPVNDPNGWSDGVYGQPTVTAMKSFQAAIGYHRTGNCWPDDWNALLGKG